MPFLDLATLCPELDVHGVAHLDTAGQRLMLFYLDFVTIPLHNGISSYGMI